MKIAALLLSIFTGTSAFASVSIPNCFNVDPSQAVPNEFLIGLTMPLDQAEGQQTIEILKQAGHFAVKGTLTSINVVYVNGSSLSAQEKQNALAVLNALNQKNIFKYVECNGISHLID